VQRRPRCSTSGVGGGGRQAHGRIRRLPVWAARSCCGRASGGIAGREREQRAREREEERPRWIFCGMSAHGWPIDPHRLSMGRQANQPNKGTLASHVWPGGGQSATGLPTETCRPPVADRSPPAADTIVRASSVPFPNLRPPES